MKLNSKGQAFSVFQLLISAIVAFAILYILLTIIGGITPPGRDPGTTVKSMIPDRLVNPGSQSISDVIVRFDKGKNISPSAITEGTGITENSVCIFAHEFKDEPNFEFGGDGTLYWMGTSGIDAKVGVICHRSDRLEGTLQAAPFDMDYVALDPSADEFKVDTDDQYSCGPDCHVDKKRTCCAIMVVRAR